MKKKTILVIAAICALSTGCVSTYFYDSTPSGPDHVYVVGARQSPGVGVRPAVWKCPTKTKGDCQRLKVDH